MNWNFMFYINSIFLGIGLAMDAFSVSIANGLNEPRMHKKKMMAIAGTFGGFQFLMPMIGWVFVYIGVQYFSALEKCIPWIALSLLGFIGGKMIVAGIQNNVEEAAAVGAFALFVQGIATSIDALSVGFATAQYTFLMSFVSSLIIAVVTFFICVAGLKLGKKFGMIFANKATVLGGVILILIGVEIFVRGVIL